MRTGLKVLISLIISLAIFGGLLFLTASGYESFTEAKIYKPAVIRNINENLSEIAASAKQWHTENTELFQNLLERDALKRSVLQEQTNADISDRNDLIAEMMSNIPGFAGLRIIDAQYQKIHFSTFTEDVLTQNDNMLSYKRYNDKGNLIPYHHISITDKGKIKITAESAADLFLYCFPFYDTYDLYKGTAIFYVSGKSLLYRLVSENIITINDDLALLSDDAHTMLGLLTGSPNVASPALKKIVLNDWSRFPNNLSVISFEGKESWILVTKESDFGYVGRLAEKYIFAFPITVKYFLIFTAFITLFLGLFLLLNIKRNRLFIAQTKIQQLHLSIIKNYLKTSQTANWIELQKELEYHRHEVNKEIKRGIGKKLLQTKGKEIDEFLQKNWQEIFDIINKTVKSKSNEKTLSGATVTNINTEELISILVNTLKGQENTSQNIKTDDKNIENIQKLTEVELSSDSSQQITPLENISEISEIEEISPIEELSEAEDVEPIETLAEVEPSSDSSQQITPLENISEISEIEEISPIEELSEAEDAEPIETLAEVEPSSDSSQQITPLENISEMEEPDGTEDLIEPDKTELIDKINAVNDYSDLDFYIDENSDIDDPMLRLNDFGYTISGPDFSELDVPISELENKEAKKVDYIDDDYSPIRSMWGKYNESPILGNLDIVGDIEPLPLLDLQEEQTIVNEDGIFIIRKTELAQPENKDFKALVDSILR